MGDTSLAGVSDLLTQIRDLLATTARPPAELLGREELAAVLGMGVSTLDRAKAAGQIGPKPFQCSGLKWHRAEVLAWLAHRDHRGELYDADTWPPVWAALQARGKGR